MKKLILPLIILLISFSCQRSSIPKDSPTLLWFDRPATIWEEATPLGNGRLGAMDFGQVKDQIIQLNEESLWAGEPQSKLPENGVEHMDTFRKMLLNKEYDKAYQYGMENLTFRPSSFRSYQTLGNLLISYDLQDSASNYQRVLNLETGIESTQFEVNGLRITRKLLISAVDDLIQLEINSSKKESLNLIVDLQREKDASIYFPDDHTIIMDGQIVDIPPPEGFDDNAGGSGPGGMHMRFAARVTIDLVGGEAKAQPTGISIKNASSVIIRLTAATDFDVETLTCDPEKDPIGRTERIMANASDRNPYQVRGQHREEHKNLFSQLQLDLGPSAAPGLCTYDRLQRVMDGETDPLLDAQYYQFGRYLLMSSSRYPGKLPANLQGIWNNHMWAPWEADYHQNINLQMNYWPALAGNLEECFEPLDNFLVPTYKLGEATAQNLYGTKGWVSHHAASLFGRTSPSGSSLSSQLINGYAFPLAGAWMSLYMYRYYEYTLDRNYLRNTAYPTLRGAAEFIKGYLMENEEGLLVTAPSSSPENNFIDPETGKGQRLTIGSTMDNQIIRDVFSAVIQSGEILDEDPDFSAELKEILNMLPSTQIGANGTIMEWLEDYEEVNPGHRHMSHLYGLHPSYQITPDLTKELAIAAQKTLDRRLANGGGHTGWSRAWLINFYARLWDGESAYENLQLLFRKSTKPNLFDNHPPFQIDGNFGGASAITEMLLQSRPDLIILLPALPEAWPTGSINGIKARGDIEIEMDWENGKLKSASFLSSIDQEISVSYGDNTKDLKLLANQKSQW